MNYLFAVGAEQRGPFPPEELLRQGLRPESLVWCEGMSQWQRADSIPELRTLLALPPVPPLPGKHPASDNKLAAGLCGILIGSLGIHKFILGMNTAGLIMLLVTLLIRIRLEWHARSKGSVSAS